MIKQDSSSGHVFPLSTTQYTSDGVNGNLYSIADDIENYRDPDGSFYLKMCYTLIANSECAFFKQSNNPFTSATRSGFQLLNDPAGLDFSDFSGL